MEPEIILPSWAAKSVAHAFHTSVKLLSLKSRPFSRIGSRHSHRRELEFKERRCNQIKQGENSNIEDFDLDAFLDNVVDATGPRQRKRASKTAAEGDEQAAQ